MAKGEKKNKKLENSNNPISKSTELDSREIRLWKEYLKKLQTTPEEFIKRYPNHPLKETILKIKL